MAFLLKFLILSFFISDAVIYAQHTTVALKKFSLKRKVVIPPQQTKSTKKKKSKKLQQKRGFTKTPAKLLNKKRALKVNPKKTIKQRARVKANTKILVNGKVKPIKAEQVNLDPKKTNESLLALRKAQIKEFVLFLKSPFQKHVKQRNCMLTFNLFQVVLADLGYNNSKARTDQYQIMHLVAGDTTQNLPTAPVFHPYDPNNNTDGYTKPAYSLNIKAPKFYSWLAPSVINHHLKQFDIAEKDVDFFMEVQDMPWDGAPLLLRPHYWLSPNEPTKRAEYYSKSFSVHTGVFHVMGGNKLLLNGQADGGLIQENRISIHNAALMNAGTVAFNPDGSIAVADENLISSSNTLALQGLDPNVSCILYSLTIHEKKAAVVKHALLNKQDHDVFQEILAGSSNMYDVKSGFLARKPRFSNPNLADEF